MVKDIFAALAANTTTTEALCADPAALATIPLPTPGDAYAALLATGSLFLRALGATEEGGDDEQRRIGELLAGGGFEPPHDMNPEPSIVLGEMLLRNLAQRANTFERAAEAAAARGAEAAASRDYTAAAAHYTEAEELRAAAAAARGDAPRFVSVWHVGARGDAPRFVSVWHVGARGINCIAPRSTDQAIGNAIDTRWWCVATHPERNERARIGQWRTLEEDVLVWVGEDDDGDQFYGLPPWQQLGEWEDWERMGRERVERLAARR